jgi:hypothetical protein
MTRTTREQVAIVAAIILVVVLVIGTISSLKDEDDDKDDNVAVADEPPYSVNGPDASGIGRGEETITT